MAGSTQTDIAFATRQNGRGHGATGGLGYEAALALAKAGAEVVLTGPRRSERPVGG